MERCAKPAPPPSPPPHVSNSFSMLINAASESMIYSILFCRLFVRRKKKSLGILRGVASVQYNELSSNGCYRNPVGKRVTFVYPPKDIEPTHHIIQGVPNTAKNAETPYISILTQNTQHKNCRISMNFSKVPVKYSIRWIFESVTVDSLWCIQNCSIIIRSVLSVDLHSAKPHETGQGWCERCDG